MSKSVVIFKHTHNAGSCALGKILEDQGFDIRSMGVPTMTPEEFDAVDPDLLLIMGAPVGVYQANDFSFIDYEVELLKKRLNKDKPTLGICFGSQLMAKALGAEVYKGEHGKEVGWHPLSLNEAAQDHPIRHLDGSQTNMFHWHGDTFDLPEGATLLASSDKYKHQAYSYGKRALGFQCHTEIRRERLKEWYVNYVGDVTGPNPIMSIDDLKQQSEDYVDTLNAQTRKFFVEWLESVGLG